MAGRCSKPVAANKRVTARAPDMAECARDRSPRSIIAAPRSRSCARGPVPARARRPSLPAAAAGGRRRAPDRHLARRRRSRRRVAGVDRARRDRRRGGLVPHAARLASHQARIGEDAAPGTVFVSREPTGETWCGEACDDDLILTRILTLDGLEDGVNRGPGCDSLERYIYLHGTNHEGLLGPPAVAWLRAPVERRCVRALRPRARRRSRVGRRAGDARRFPIRGGEGRFHYAGLGGAGMSALAQFQVMTGGRVSGSDRAFDRGERGALARSARAARHRGAAAGRQRPRPGLRRACRLDRRRGARARLSPRRAANGIPDRPSLGAARAFRARPIAPSR